MERKETSQIQREPRYSYFPVEEFKRREHKLKELMSRYGIDALLVFAPENLFYFAGIKKENMLLSRRWRKAAIFAAGADPILLVPHDLYENARLTSWVKDIRSWGGAQSTNHSEDFMKAYVKVIHEMDLSRKTLGMEIWNDSPAVQVDLPYVEYRQLRQGLKEAKIVDAGDMIWEQRIVKTELERKIIRELAVITTKGFTAGLEAVREGVTEKEIVRKMYRVMIEAGLDNEPFHSRLPLKGPGHFPAAILGPHDTVLKKGDMLQYDGGPCHKGYWSDIQRNACVGEPPALERMLYDAALEAEEAAVQVIKPGIRVKEIHNAATEALVRLVPSFDINRCVFVGHGIGLHTHELPYLVPYGREADFVIREGMYLAVEVSAFDAPQFRVIGGFPEDNILVTANGCDNLTKGIPKQLWIG